MKHFIKLSMYVFIVVLFATSCLKGEVDEPSLTFIPRRFLQPLPSPASKIILYQTLDSLAGFFNEDGPKDSLALAQSNRIFAIANDRGIATFTNIERHFTPDMVYYYYVYFESTSGIVYDNFDSISPFKSDINNYSTIIPVSSGGRNVFYPYIYDISKK